ncbi:sestrin-1 isoform X3 [Pristis pectinata]|uniref:sestrin-1 isoform X3 n=1 Tax=Pristis pectinata TaxID=685728 RepID=UPI00223E29E6|nr:sestrin-1 isoform X3 [Pristis pectinata]
MAGRTGAAGRWDGLCSRDPGRRQAALDGVRQAVLSLSERLGGGGPPAPSPGCSSPADGLNEYLVRLLVLSRRCPFSDVRDKCGAILQVVQEMGVRIPRPLAEGPSEFIPEKEYLDSFLKTQHYLMHVDGPLPYCYRHYIAIMAAAQHQCSYLVNLHVNDFLQVGGDPKWLAGLDSAPLKLQTLSEVNKILAHRPWLITKDHIEKLLKAEEHGWSLAELIHVVVLLTHYHSLASFTFGCGINPELRCDGGHSFQLPSVGNCYLFAITNGNNAVEERLNVQVGSEQGTETTCEVEALMEKMKRLQECRDEEETSQEEMATRFEREKTESFFVAPSENEKSIDTREISRHFEDPSYGYKDFCRHGEQYVPTFRAQDYTWEDHGYSLVNRLYPDVGQLLDEKFQKAYNLTYNTMAMHKDVDTSMLRRAIWNYIHCMFGIKYDDYDYGEINHLLDRNFKVYIKTVVCSPAKTTKRMYDSFWRQFKHSEKIHVNLLLMEARMQAELLYALTAITRYLT